MTIPAPRASRSALFVLAFATLQAFAAPAGAEGNLVLYCAVQEEWCRNMVAAFERQTGIKVAMTRKSSARALRGARQ